MPDIWEKNFLFNKCNIQGNKAFHFQYKQRFSTLPTFQVKGHEEEAPPACRTCSCQALEYSKELWVQRFQSLQILGKPACTRQTCRPPGKVKTSRVDHSGHNTAGQFFWSRAIPARRAERHDESTGLERHVLLLRLPMIHGWVIRAEGIVQEIVIGEGIDEKKIVSEMVVFA